MIEHPYTDKLQRVAKLAGNVVVCSRRFGDPAGVIVRKDHRRRIVLQRRPPDFARVHARTVQRAAKHFFECEYAVAIVEEQASEHLIRKVG